MENIVNNGKPLTIVMPTYNRRERLLNQLSSIYKYGDLDYYYMVIVDNCSNYDVMAEIRENFPKEFVNNIEYHRNSINTQMGYNLARCFLYSKSKYVFQISDDDEYIEDFMDKIKTYINKYPDAMCIQFALGMSDKKFDDIVVSSLKEYDAQLFKRYLPGDCLYMGNKIYNMDALSPYLSDIFEYSYTMGSFLLPVLHSLWEQKNLMIISDQQLCNYIPNSIPGCSFFKITLAMATLYDVKWSDGTNYKQIKYVRNLLAGHWRIQTLRFLCECLKLEPKYRRYAYNRLISSIYSDWWKYPTEWLYIFLYHVEIITRIPLLSKAVPAVLKWMEKRKKNFIQSQKTNNGIIYRLYQKRKEHAYLEK